MNCSLDCKTLDGQTNEVYNRVQEFRVSRPHRRREPFNTTPTHSDINIGGGNTKLETIVTVVLGLPSFDRKFIPNFRHLCYLTDLTKKGSPN